MTTYKAKNGKKYSVETLAAKVADGTDNLESIAARCGQDVADKISKHTAKARREERNETLTLTGKIVAETDAAVCFCETIGTAGVRFTNGEETWLPKSAAQAIRGAVAGLDQVRVAGWFARKQGWLNS